MARAKANRTSNSDTPKALNDFLTTDDIAQWLGTNRFSIYRYLKQGMPHYRLGVKHLFKREEVEAWMKACAVGKDHETGASKSSQPNAFRITRTHQVSIDEATQKLKELMR